MDVNSYLVIFCVGIGFGGYVLVSSSDSQDMEYKVNIGVITDCSNTSRGNGCDERAETIHVNNTTFTFNLLRIHIATSEIYDVTQAIKRSRENVDFYLVLSIPPPMSPTLGILQRLGIPYMRMCVLLTSDNRQTICLPKHGENLYLQKNTLYLKNATETSDLTPRGCHDKTCDTGPNQPTDDVAHNLHGSDVYSADNYLSRIVTSLVSAEKWEHVLIFYEAVFGNDMGSLFDAFSKIGLIARSTHVIDRLSEDEFIRIFDKSSEVGKQEPFQIAVLCKNMCSKLLKAITVYDLQKKGTKAVYYFTEILVVSMASSDTFYQELNVSTFNNIAVVTLPLWVSSKNEHNIDCTEGHSSIMQYLHTALEATTLGNSNEMTTVPNILLDQMEMYQVSLASLWFPVETLIWDRDGRSLRRVGLIHLTGERKLSGSLFPNKDFGFNGRQLLVSSLAFYPFVENVGNDSYDGLCFDILRQLAVDMNFTYRLTTSPDLEWGVTDDQGHWSGLIGQLQRN
ncbi:uncharacterized protein LOC132555355, partial [Ylistrum balloti]|uniref:uncharacterized protein LOC132555355 n=1 Tax=Ylistrum balloti TaxID=509963 RepID=UPI002905BE3D